MNQITQNKLSTNFNPNTMQVVWISSYQVTAECLNEKKLYARNISSFKKNNSFITRDRNNVEIMLIPCTNYIEERNFATITNLKDDTQNNIVNANQNVNIVLKVHITLLCGPMQIKMTTLF